MQNGHLMAATLTSLFVAGTLVDQDQIRVNTVPKKLKDGENDSLTTLLSMTGAAEELDAELSRTIVGFVSAHLQMKNTLGDGDGGDGSGFEGRSERGACEVEGGVRVVPRTESAQPLQARERLFSASD